MQFQLTPLEPGKWYVSAKPVITRVGNTGERQAQPVSDKDTRVGGPFDSEPEAQADLSRRIEEDPNLKNRLHVWQAKSDVSNLV
jgi:hypothetical protein